MLKRVPLSGVKILPGLFRSRMKLNEDYLMELDSICLLQNFYLEAGIQLPGMQSVRIPRRQSCTGAGKPPAASSAAISSATGFPPRQPCAPMRTGRS